MATRVDKLVSDYQRIANEKMHGLPIYNENLTVEAVAFREWEGHQLGVLITPWFMNLLLLPTNKEDWSDCEYGTKMEREFPSGRYDFDTCDGAEAGIHQSAALFSTVVGFTDQDTARKIACEVMIHLFRRNGGQNEMRQAAPTAATESMMEKEMSRRDLFRWLVPESDGEERPGDA